MGWASKAGTLPPALPARHIPSVSRARSWPEAAPATLPARLSSLTPPCLLFQVCCLTALAEQAQPGRWMPKAPFRRAPPALPPLHPAKASPDAAQTAHACLFASPARPCLPLTLTP